MLTATTDAASVSANAITFTKVNLPLAAAAFTLNIKNLYVDASMIPAGGSIGLSLIAISNDSATADSAIFGDACQPDPFGCEPGHHSEIPQRDGRPRCR